MKLARPLVCRVLLELQTQCKELVLVTFALRALSIMDLPSSLAVIVLKEHLPLLVAKLLVHFVPTELPRLQQDNFSALAALLASIKIQRGRPCARTVLPGDTQFLTVLQSALHVLRALIKLMKDTPLVIFAPLVVQVVQDKRSALHAAVAQ